MTLTVKLFNQYEWDMREYEGLTDRQRLCIHNWIAMGDMDTGTWHTHYLCDFCGVEVDPRHFNIASTKSANLPVRSWKPKKEDYDIF